MRPQSRTLDASEISGGRSASDGDSFGATLYDARRQSRLSQAEIAAIAKVSTSYYSAIENGKRPPPPRRTAARLARAVGLDGRAADALVATAVRQRGSDRRDEDLPGDVQLLISDLRANAFTVPHRFIRALRLKLREAVP